MNLKFEELITGYLENHVGVSDEFITEKLAEQLQQNLINLEKGDKMKLGGIGNDLVKDPGQSKRGDKIYWIEGKTKDPHELEFLTLIENFIVYLNETCYVGISSYEFHYAFYETGTSYKRHIDQFQNNGDRKFSMISYLNSDWHREDGGELLIYQEDKVRNILPNIQKTVFFKSDTCEHEVSHASRPRMSVTGWLKS